jgi:GNAT superfamily N-acetyltransferase
MMDVASPVRLVRRATPEDDRSAAAFLAERGADVVARLGRLEDTARAAELIAEDGGSMSRLLSFLIDGEACEVLTLHSAERHTGVGTVLLDALRFYQRRGFRLVRVDTGAVDRARETVKPSIPLIGDHGIAMRDEVLLEKALAGERG